MTRWTLPILAARARLRGRLLAVVQTAAAAVAAWYLAVLLLPDPRPSFAAIAAVVAVGATHGRRAGRAVQLIGGVVLGVAVADLLIQTIGTGGVQIGVMVVLAMSAAILLGGGELLVVEAAVSAILLVALDPGTGAGFSPNRILEAIIGGGAALAVTSLFFPPDPTVAPGRAVQAVFVALGRSLERIAAALEQRDPADAERALVDARAIDDLVRAVDSELAAGRETARYSPPRRAARVQLDRYDRSVRQLDFAVRNTRVLARHALRLARAGESAEAAPPGADVVETVAAPPGAAIAETVAAPPGAGADPVPAALPAAVRDLALAVWELAAAYDAPAHADEARRAAVRAAAAAAALDDTRPEPAMLAGQVRAVAVDLVRASELVIGELEPADERPTEELLAAPAAA